MKDMQRSSDHRPIIGEIQRRGAHVIEFNKQQVATLPHLAPDKEPA